MSDHRLLKRPPAGPVPFLGRTMIVVQILAALLFVGALLHAEGVRVPFTGSGGWKLEASFSDASGLREGLRSPVLVSGVPSGEVEDVRLVNGRAIVRMRLDDDVRGKIHADAVATVEPRSALEDLTIDLAPGSASRPAIGAGDRIATQQTEPNIPLDRVTEVLDADTRTQVAILLDQLSTGLNKRPGALRDALVALTPVVDDTTRVTTALSDRRKQLVALVGSLEKIATAAAGHSDSLGDAVRAGRATLRVTAARSGDVARTLQALPGALAALDSALARTQALAVPLTPALQRLRPALRELPGALDSLQSAVPSTRALVGDLDALAEGGATPVRRLRSILTRARPVAQGLEKPTAQLQPIIKAIDDTKDGIGLLGERFSGVLSTNDGNGAILRGLGFFEPVNPANFGFSASADKARVNADVARALTRVCKTDNPIACLVRYLVPGLPGAVRNVSDALRPVGAGGAR